MINNQITLIIDHPIFGTAEALLYIKLSYEPPNYIDGYLESGDYYYIDEIELLKLNNKVYSNSIMRALETFIYNKYENEIIMEA